MNRLAETGWGGEGAMNWQSSIETYIATCEIGSWWEFAVMTQGAQTIVL